MSRTSAPDLAERIAGLSPEKRELFERKLRERGASALQTETISRRAERRTAPLSFAQQRLYFLDRIEPGGSAYNVPRAIRIRGALDVTAMERALEELLRRHESLRSRFREVDGRIICEIVPPRPFPLPAIEVRRDRGRPGVAEAIRLADEEAELPFDLANGPIVRGKLLRLDSQDHILLLTLHHIGSDAWSAEVLFEELSALYAAFAAGKPSPLPELPIQYGDFAEWQRGWLSGKVLDEQLSYWRKQLAGAPVLELPTDHPRPALQSFRGDVESIRFSRETTEALRELSRHEGVTLFMTLLAGLQTLLFRYTGQEDIAVGTPIANRNRPEIEGLIGFFLNTLVLRSNLSGNPTFRELLGRVREVALGGYAHQDLPFEKLVEELQPSRDLGRNPLFQTMLSLRITPSQALELPDLAVEHLEIRNKTSKFDLSLFFNEKAEGLFCAVEYATDLFGPSTIRRLIKHLQTLLASAAADPDQPLANLPILTEPERRQLLIEWNNTAADYPSGSCVHELFEAQVERSPDAVAIRDGREEIPFRELNRRANRLAHFLRKRGVGPEVVVGVCMARSARVLEALLGVLKAGGAYVPLDPSYPQERLAFMLRDSGARLLLAEERSAPRLSGHEAQIICLDAIGAELLGQPETNPASGAGPGNLAYVIYTSGSTGRPKGVEALHRACVNRLAWMWRAYPFVAGEVCCQKTALSFVDSVWEIFGPLLQGTPSIVLPEEEVHDPQALVGRLASAGVTRIVLVPSLLKALLDSGGDLATRLPLLKWWVSSGETLSLDLYRRFRRAVPDAVLINLYGSSEVSADVTCYDRCSGEPRYSVPIGRPIANTQVYILDEHRQPVPIGVPGELCIGGAGLARGYHNRPELTAERFLPDPFARTSEARLFKTGDRARYLPDGQIEYLGRRDHQVKIRGHRIELGELEAALSAHPALVRVVATVREEVPGEPRLIAYVVPRKERQTTPGELRGFLQSRLPAFMLPSAFVFLEALPLTPSGKIDRNALPAPDGSRPELETVFVEPETAVERTVAEIWKKVLSLDRVGVEDDFFALGGHSLLVIQVASRLREEFRVDLPLRSFFETRTIAGLAHRIEKGLPAERDQPPPPPIARVPAEDRLPLSFAQQRLWVLDQLEPGNTAYLIRRAFRLTGPLQADTLRQAIDAVIARHASLRTRFDSADGVPHQSVDAAEGIPFSEIDLTPLLAEEREAEAVRRETAEAQRPFDLSRGPLLRVTLLRVGPQDHVFLLTIHHIVSDAWSLGILFKEISVLYRAFSAGKPSPLPELPIRYSDYAVWQRGWLQADVLERLLSFWRRELAGAPEVFELVSGRPRPARRSQRGERRSVAFPQELTETLKSLGQRQQATLYMTLVAAFAALLSGHTKQGDILIGSPIAGRNQVEAEGLIGLFLNTLLLRTRLAGDPTFFELLGRVRETALGAYAHQDLPFEKLVEELSPTRSLAYNPLFQVWFVLQNAPASSLDLPGVRATPIQPAAITARHDLQLTMWETSEGLRGSIDFSTDLFDTAVMDQLTEELGLVLHTVGGDPEIRLSGLQRILDQAGSRRKAYEQERLEEASVRSLKSAKRKAMRA